MPNLIRFIDKVVYLCNASIGSFYCTGKFGQPPPNINGRRTIISNGWIVLDVTGYSSISFLAVVMSNPLRYGHMKIFQSNTIGTCETLPTDNDLLLDVAFCPYPDYYWCGKSEGGGSGYNGKTFSFENILFTKKYLSIKAWLVEPWYGYVELVENCIKIKGTAKTPQGYPVYNATIMSDIGARATTDKDGKFEFEDCILTSKLWGEKTIDKTIPNLTAKEISELKSINADEP